MGARTGKVLRIEKTSIHDGEGLRTVVFVKGCPLRCRWCSTPESQSMECMMDYGYDATPEQIIREVCKDEIFFFHSGGGVTVSGGEVLMQSDFVRDILSGCREEGVETAIESSLFGPYEALEKLLPYLDAVYVDFKIADDELHRYYTGVSNETIRRNIHRMAEDFGGPIHLRIPTIPTVNRTQDNMEKTAEFARSLRHLTDIELLPYHRLGMETYDKLGMEYMLRDLKTPTAEEMQQAAGWLLSADPGCPVLISGERAIEVA